MYEDFVRFMDLDEDGRRVYFEEHKARLDVMSPEERKPVSYTHLIWYLRQHPKVMNLPWIEKIRRADRDNTIDVYISDDHEDVRCV